MPDNSTTTLPILSPPSPPAIRRRKLVLLGFSAGGGYALHAAAAPVGKSFERAVLLSPMLGPRVPTYRPTQAWAAPYIPRIIALSLLNRVGIHAFDHLTVLAFAIDPKRADILTDHYLAADTRFYDKRLRRRSAQCVLPDRRVGGGKR
jgi:alpha-beta hydrolase superfamily lysophospholipase